MTYIAVVGKHKDYQMFNKQINKLSGIKFIHICDNEQMHGIVFQGIIYLPEYYQLKLDFEVLETKNRGAL